MPSLKQINLGELGMAFDPETGDSYQLNDSARTIVNAIRAGLSQEEILARLSLEYSISKEQALTDLLEFQVQLKILGFSE